MRKNKIVPRHLKSKIIDIEWNVNSMFKLDYGNGHDFNEHLTMALGSISDIK